MAFNAILQAVDAEMTAELQMYQGYSAYEIAIQHGFEGSEAEWLASLHATSATVNGQSRDQDGNISLDASDIPVSGDEGAVTVAQSLQSKVSSVDIVDSLTSDDATKPLSAKQGKALKALIDVIPVADGAGAHNAIYRGASLGTSVTAEQWAAIGNGTFTGLYIGDYWTISSIVYRIAAFDYYYNTGDTACTTHHVVIVPDTMMYSHAYNSTSTADGGYAGSDMYTSGLSAAKTTINTAFGTAHILSHRQFLSNAINNGMVSGGSWYDSTVELLTEQNVYGCPIFANHGSGQFTRYDYTLDKSQYPLFAHKPDLIANRQWYWLRDIATSNAFCSVYGNGFAGYNGATDSHGVRPAFCIKA